LQIYIESQWTRQGEIRSSDYAVYYFGGVRAEEGVIIVVHKIILRIVVKKNVCDDIIIALSSWMTVRKERILKTEIESTRSHTVENSL
jgi:hypothetical protein